MGTRFLTYDIPSLQAYIFLVPRLRSITGASALVVRFDRDAGAVAEKAGARRVFTGAGHGCFECPSDGVVEVVKARLVELARPYGIGLAFGLGDDPLESIDNQVEDRPFCPGSLDGTPCAESALFPVRRGVVRTHPVIAERTKWRQGRRPADELKAALLTVLDGRLPERVTRYDSWQFFSNVDQDPGDPADECAEAAATIASLGTRRRWAVIRMDGDEVGSAFAAVRTLGRTSVNRRTVNRSGH
jgi:hypothetical protein